MLIMPGEAGLHVPAAQAVIDPWQPAETALITHAHADHARPGSKLYYCAEACVPLLKHRLGADAPVKGVPYGQTLRLGTADVSFHPAGHVLGSAQVRVAAGGRVWVASGDYKREPDPTCAPFEVVPCHTFITEATFALPLYVWPPVEEEIAKLVHWWQAAAHEGRTAVVFCYGLGKAQRLLAHLKPHIEALPNPQPVLLHGAMVGLTQLYRNAGVPLVATAAIDPGAKTTPADFAGRLVLAPPGSNGSPWLRRFGKPSTAFISGWMRVRGQRRRRGYDQGFVISDHADWPGLLRTITQTGAQHILATHGKTEALVKYLNDHKNLTAAPLQTSYGEEEEGEA